MIPILIVAVAGAAIIGICKCNDSDNEVHKVEAQTGNKSSKPESLANHGGDNMLIK